MADELLATGQAIDCGHHIAEEAPDELASHLVDFFAAAELPPNAR